jgi:N-acetylglucosaminyl-diphospho-decaprenol L-rhamnosyltransferase
MGGNPHDRRDMIVIAGRLAEPSGDDCKPMTPAISVIVVNYNSARDTLACVASLHTSRGIDHEIIVVDNASRPDDRELLRALDGVSLLLEEANRGFGSGCNRGVEASSGRYLLFVNPDVIVPSATTLADLVAVADATVDLGALGCRIADEDGRTQPSAYRRYPGLLDHAWDYAPAIGSLLFFFGVRYSPAPFPLERLSERLAVAHLLGAFMLVPRVAFEEAGGFDEGFFLYREETDLCERIAALGRQLVYTPDPVVIHRSGTSTDNRRYAHLDPRFMTSAYRYFRLRHGAAYARAAWLLAVAGIITSLPYMRLLHSLRRWRGGETADVDLLIRRLRGALEWHVQNRREVRRPVQRELAHAGSDQVRASRVSRPEGR